MVTKNKLYLIAPIFISLMAVLMSQMKPLYTYFEKPQLDILIGKNVNFYEGWGNLGANIFLQIINSGDENGTIKEVNIYISSNESNYEKILLGQSYYLQPDAVAQNEVVTQIPFSYVTVGKKSIWTGFLNAYGDFSKSKQKKIQEFTQRVQIDLNSKWQSNETRPQIDKSLLNEVISFHKSNLKNIDIGEYQLLVLAWIQGYKEPSLKRAYSFTIYDSDISKLSRKEQEYPFGGGIIFPIPNNMQQQMNFNSVLTEITNKSVIDNLHSGYKRSK